MFFFFLILLFINLLFNTIMIKTPDITWVSLNIRSSAYLHNTFQNTDVAWIFSSWPSLVLNVFAKDAHFKRQRAVNVLEASLDLKLPGTFYWRLPYIHAISKCSITETYIFLRKMYLATNATDLFFGESSLCLWSTIDFTPCVLQK